MVKTWLNCGAVDSSTAIGLTYIGQANTTTNNTTNDYTVWLQPSGHDISRVTDILGLQELLFQATGKLVDKYKAKIGESLSIEMPDGALLNINSDGNWSIDSKDAKVIYKSNNIKEFNKYINASDLLEEFIAWCGKTFTISKEEFLSLPIESFIKWLIIRAAIQDGEQPPELQVAPPQPRCRACGRFITKERHTNGINFCSDQHFLVFSRTRLGMT